MPTSKHRLSVTFPDGMYEDIVIYQKSTGIKSQSKAIIDLIEKGIKSFESGDVPKSEGNTVSGINEEEQTILSAYRRADDHTRQMVDLALAPYTPPEQSKMAM